MPKAYGHRSHPLDVTYWDQLSYQAVSHRLPTANREPPTYWWYADAFGKGL